MAKTQKVNWNKLLKRAKKGDPSSRNELCEKIRVRLWTNLQYTIKRESKQALEDLLHDCLETFLEKLDQVDSNPQFYADRILRNKIGDLLRSRRGPRGVSLSTDRVPDAATYQFLTDKDLETADPGSDFTQNLDATELLDQLLISIKKMDPFCKAYFLARLEDLDPNELKLLVEEMDPDLKRSAFYVRILRCRRKLRKLLRPYLEEK